MWLVLALGLVQNNTPKEMLIVITFFNDVRSLYYVNIGAIHESLLIQVQKKSIIVAISTIGTRWLPNIQISLRKYCTRCVDSNNLGCASVSVLQLRMWLHTLLELTAWINAKGLCRVEQRTLDCNG